MKRILAFVLIFAVLSQPLFAEPRRWFKDWKFYAGEAVIGVAVALDAQSSCRALSYGAVESAPLAFGSRSCGATAGRLAGAFGFYTSMNLLERHFGSKDRSPAIRSLTPWMVPAAVCVVHCTAAAHNYGIAPPEVTTNVPSHLAWRTLVPRVPVL